MKYSTPKLERLEKIAHHFLILPLFVMFLIVLFTVDLYVKLSYKTFSSIIVFAFFVFILFERVLSFLILREKRKMEVWEILSK